MDSAVSIVHSRCWKRPKSDINRQSCVFVIIIIIWCCVGLCCVFVCSVGRGSSPGSGQWEITRQVMAVELKIFFGEHTEHNPIEVLVVVFLVQPAKTREKERESFERE